MPSRAFHFSACTAKSSTTSFRDVPNEHNILFLFNFQPSIINKLGAKMTFCIRLLSLCCLSCLALSACGVSGQRSPYPPPDTLAMAEPQRHEFVQLFLQGRWCESAAQFDRSTETYLLQDDFCAAAQNHLLAWKLKQYVDIVDDVHLEQARQLMQTGLDCPALVLPAMDNQDITPESAPDSLPDKDHAYRDLLEGQRFEQLASRLAGEQDQLYASVYGRKAALSAMRSGQPDLARVLLRQTRDLDARQGWIVFLIKDWRSLHDLAPDEQSQQGIQQRIQRLQGLIQPCP